MSLHLVAVGGLPGTGKSVAAKAIAHRLNAVLLRTDEVRKELFPHPSYTPEEGRLVYDRSFERAAELLSNQHSVVLDATFRQESLRQRAREIAETAGADWHFILVTAPEALVRCHIAQRTNDPSDANFQTYLQLRQEFEPIRQLHITLDNSGTLADLSQQIEKLFP
jgi:predicted kinase